MRQDITFMSQGLRCKGWLYVPNDLPVGQKMPGIVMAHGYSGVKEMYLSNFAERFVGAGFITLVFDYRYCGSSEGEPRGQLFPHEQVEDYRSAITWISDHPQVDPERIGVWGTSKSGGHVLYLAAYDKRVKAVVAQVPKAIVLLACGHFDVYHIEPWLSKAAGQRQNGLRIILRKKIKREGAN